MIFASIILSAISILFIALGFIIIKKEKISLFHSYHYEKVKDKDKKAFCTLSGLGVLLIGIGILATALLLLFTDSALSFIAFGIGFAIGICLLVYATNKYNK